MAYWDEDGMGLELEELWNMELLKTSNELEKKVVQYRAWHPNYFVNEYLLLEG
jgi:isoprenylcysteine carboxyl methyltransferase (ICMT) family protein YpbQ